MLSQQYANFSLLYMRTPWLLENIFYACYAINNQKEIYCISCILSTKILFYLCTQESEAPQGLGGAMISAVKRGCVEAVSQLLLQGAPLNVKDSVRHLLFILPILHAK